MDTSTTNTHAVPTTLLADRGPVADAALVLIDQSTLRDHVTDQSNASITEIRRDDSIPFEMWGSGSQALWRLLAAMIHRRHEVSLYDVVSRLDLRNRRAVADAMAVLCGVAR